MLISRGRLAAGTLLALVSLLIPSQAGIGTGKSFAASGPQSGPTAAPVQANLHALHPVPPPTLGVLPLRHAGGDQQLAREKAAAQNLPPSVTSTTTTSPSVSGTGRSFSAISYSESGCGCAPPDGAVSVSSSYVVGAVNTAFKVWNTSGSVVKSATSLASVLGQNSACYSNVSDPFTAYDTAGGKFILGALTYDSVYDSAICVAVATDPTSTWTVYAFPGPAGDLLDFPRLGVSADAIYVSVNQFQGGSTYLGPRLYAYNKAAMYSGSTANSLYQDVSDASMGSLDTVTPARGLDASATMYLTGVNDCGSCSTVGVWTWTSPFGSNTFTEQGVVSIQTYAEPPNAPEPTATFSGNLDTNDARELGAYDFNGTVYAAHTIGYNPGSGTVAAVQWYEISVAGTPSVTQQGVMAPNDGLYRFFPNVTVDGSGDMALGYATSSGSQYPNVVYTGRTPSDPTGQLEPETTLVNGQGSIDTLFYTSRYGDYAGDALAPDGCTIWHLEEYAPSGGTWSSWVGAYKFANCGSAPTPSLSITSAAQSVTAGATSGAITVQASPAPAGNLTVALTSSSTGTYAFYPYSSAGCSTTASSSVTIPANASSASFCYSDTKAGTPTITASASGYTSATQAETIKAALPANITISPSSTTVPSGGKTTFTATGTDPYGNAADMSTATWTLTSSIGSSVSPTSGATTSYTAGSTTTTASDSLMASDNGHTSNTATITVTAPPPPSAPTGLSATTNKKKNWVNLTWTDSQTGVTFNVYRNTTSSMPATPLAKGVTTTSYTDQTVTRSATYYYWVTAVNSAGQSAPAGPVSAVG